MGGTSRSQTISTKLQQIAEQAGRYPDMVFTTLAHLIEVDFLREAYRRTRKSAAPGVDGVTAGEYVENLEDNLRDLYERLRSGRNIAPTVARAWIDEGTKKRGIVKPTFEDKIVQRAVVPQTPAPAVLRAIPDSVPETARALPILRGSR